jgi:hypothetical protein
MTSTMRTVAAALLVLGGIAYADWVLQLFLPVHADLTTSFISELSAGNQPHHDLFRAADVVGGVLLTVGGATAWAVVRRRPATWLSLVVLGACIVLEATVPLDKTFTFAAVLPRTGTHAWWQRVTEPHGLASLVETTSFLVLFASCTVALRRTTVPERRQRLLAGIGAAAIVCGVADSVLMAALLMGGHSGPLGLVQRVGVTLTAVWLAAAPALLVTGRHDRDRSGEAARGREAARPVSR